MQSGALKRIICNTGKEFHIVVSGERCSLYSEIGNHESELCSLPSTSQYSHFKNLLLTRTYSVYLKPTYGKSNTLIKHNSKLNKTLPTLLSARRDANYRPSYLDSYHRSTSCGRKLRRSDRLCAFMRCRRQWQQLHKIELDMSMRKRHMGGPNTEPMRCEKLQQDRAGSHFPGHCPDLLHLQPTSHSISRGNIPGVCTFSKC